MRDGLARALSHSAGIVAGMSTRTHFNPLDGEARPCWHCTSFAGMAPGGNSAVCSHPGCARTRSAPERGCSAFMREVGADDEPGPPACAARPASKVRDYRPPVVPVRWAP